MFYTLYCHYYYVLFIHKIMDIFELNKQYENINVIMSRLHYVYQHLKYEVKMSLVNLPIQKINQLAKKK